LNIENYSGRITKNEENILEIPKIKKVESRNAELWILKGGNFKIL
jgi:hypothetical protein